MSAAVHEVPSDPPAPDPDTKPRALVKRDKVDGHRIERVLEHTATQVTYVARDTTTQHEVLLIEYLPADLVVRQDDGSVAPREPGLAAAYALGCKRFTQQATRLTRFEHPSLPHLYRCWESRGTVYATMKNQRGSTLMAARPAMERPPEEAWLRVLVHHLLEALDTLHASGVVHAGVSPRCIVLRRDGPTLLAEAGDPLGADDPAAAAAFIAPELRLGADDMSVGPWTDLWGLAASLHFAITGEAPAEGVPVGDGVRRLRGSHPQLRYSDNLLQAIDAALVAVPARRPQSVAAFRQKVGLPAVTRRAGTTVPGSFDPTPAFHPAAKAPPAPAAATSAPPTVAPTAPGPLTEPPVLQDAVGAETDAVSGDERNAIHSALAGFEAVEPRTPQPAQSAHAPGAYEPEEPPLSRLRLLGIGVLLAALLGVVGFAVWQLVEKQRADDALKRASAGLQAESATAAPPPAPLAASVPAVRRNRPVTGPEGRELVIPPVPAQRPGKP